MIKSSKNSYITLVFSVILIISTLTNCNKPGTPIKFPTGTFPDTVLSVPEINSAYDDYNISLYELRGEAPIVFSSNRKSMGGQFDLEQAIIAFTFDQTTGSFNLQAEMYNDQFLVNLITKAQTAKNDFGPYRLYSPIDGYEYLILASETNAGDLDLFYLRNQPAYNLNMPEILGPSPVKLLNSASDDAYLSFDYNIDSAYFTSDRDGNFDIFLLQKPKDTELSEWFDMEPAAATKVDSVNSTSNDKCPILFRNVLYFASDRPGGLGGYDLYYSVFKNGNWNSPVNMGPGLNTASDEYRPVIGFHPDFTNLFMMFSSNRPGGKGGFDLYFRGIEYTGKN